MPNGNQLSGCAVFILSICLFLSLCVIGALGSTLLLEGWPTLQSQMAAALPAPATPTQLPLPQPVAVRVAPELAIYTQQAVGYTRLIDDSLSEIEQLLFLPQWGEAAWHSRVHTYVMLIQNANVGLVKLAAPPPLTDAHYRLLVTVDACVQASRSASLGIELVDAGLLYQAALQMQACNAGLSSAQGEIDGLVVRASTIQPPEPVIFESPAIVIPPTATPYIPPPIIIEPTAIIIPATSTPYVAPAPPAPAPAACDPSYPDVCIPPGPPDLNCEDIVFRNFRVIGADPHGFDGERDGLGCE